MSLLERLRNLLPHTRPLIPEELVSYRPIGVVRNRVREPRPHGWQEVKSDIILQEQLEPAVEGLEGFSHAIVVFHIDRVPEQERRLRVKVGNEPEPPERGVLASRSQVRPNPLGVSVVKILHRRKNALRVSGLDALDGTPVLDIEPYLPAYDAVADATLPDWARPAAP